MIRSLFLVCLMVAAGAAADLPTLLPGTWECHGTVRLRGQTEDARFWLRLLPADKAFGGNRVLQLVYTPPPAAALGGTHLADVPFLLLDDHARIVAWNERSGLSQTAPGAPGAATYRVTRDRTPADDTAIASQERTVAGERGWDRSIAPLLLAIAWRGGSRAQLPLIDLYGDEPAAAVAWNGTEISLGGAALRAEADGAGRLRRLLDERGTPLVIVREWLKQGDLP